MKNKVVLLSSANSIHTIQWARYLIEQGVDIQVISQQPITNDFPKDIPLIVLPYKGFLGYFLNAFHLKKILKTIAPDLINVHYASGYGTTARLVNFHPYVLSVWGSDVFEFPYRSVLHKFLLKKNLQNADLVASTSQNMAKQTELLIDNEKTIEITPFGVDLVKFNPSKYPKSNEDIITIGTVKTLKHVYGIDILIRTLAIIYTELRAELPMLSSKLRFKIVGGGPDLNNLKQLAENLGIANLIDFVGEVLHDQVPEELSKLDIYVALSRQESFGVAILEAQAMGLPVVVSDVGGLPEVVEDGKTGFVVESENPNQAAEMIIKLILDQELRKSFSKNAESFVQNNFTWPECAKKMQTVYQKTLSNIKSEN